MTRGQAMLGGAGPMLAMMQDGTRHAVSVADGKTRISVPFSHIVSRRSMTGVARETKGSGSGGSGGTHCTWRIALEPCTLCFPFTNWCWEDECLVIEFDCSNE